MSFSRRTLIKNLLKTGIAFPFLPSLLSGKGIKNVKFPKRLLIVFTGNGQYADHWYPKNHLNLVKLGRQARGLSLHELDGPLSEVFDQKFNKFLPKINLIRGLDIIPVIGVRDHWSSKLLNAWGRQYEQYETIDQIIARSSKVYPSTSNHMKSLHFLVPGNSELPSSYLSYQDYRGQVTPKVPISNLHGAFNLVFDNGFLNGKVHRLLNDDYKQLEGSPVLSKADRGRVSAHLDYLSDLAKKSENLGPACKEAWTYPDPLNEKTLAEAFVDLMAAAVKCDISRVLVFNLTECADAKYYSFVPKGLQHFHNLTHMTETPGAVEALLAIQKFHANVVHRLLENLDEIEDEEQQKTYLDHSVVLWGSEQSVKFNAFTRSANVHTSEDLPVFIAGSCGGSLKTGQYLDYRLPNRRKRFQDLPFNPALRPPSTLCREGICEFDENYPGLGRPYNEFLITLMMAMGLSPEEWEKNGEAGIGDYSQNFENQYELGDKRSPLPHLLRS